MGIPRKVASGDAVLDSAEFHNRLVDLIAWQLRTEKRIAVGRGLAGGDLCRVDVRNDTGDDRDRFDVVGVAAPAILPSESEDGFLYESPLVGSEPATSDFLKFAVLLEPLASGDVGPAAIGGLVPVRLRVKDADDTHADVESGECGRLITGPVGAAQILWKESGTTSDGDVANTLKWAIVRVGAWYTPGTTIAVTLSQTGGSNGTNTTAPTYTYTATSLGGRQLGTTLSPAVSRAKGAVTAATKGLGYFDASGGFVLFQAFEIPDTEEDCT